MTYFVILFQQGENWKKEKKIWEQDLKQHKVYWGTYREEHNKVIGAGPFMDDTGGLIILEVENIEEATRLANADPAVIAKVFQPTIHPWQPLSKKF